MKTESAKEFNEHLLQANMLYWFMVDSDYAKTGIVDEDLYEKHKSDHIHVLRKKFDAELLDNYKEYNDIDLLGTSMCSIFSESLQIFYSSDATRKIFDTNPRVEYVIRLKKNIEKQVEYLKFMVKCIERGAGGFFFYNIENRCIDLMNELYASDKDKSKPKITDLVIKDERLVFENLKSECDALSSYSEKLKFISGRLIDFNQWKLQNDNTCYLEEGLVSDVYYPSFESLCNLEIKRIEKQIELDMKYAHFSPEGNNVSVAQSSEFFATGVPRVYKWNGTDTDFLELFTALYRQEAIIRNDGASMPRKELLDYFQSIFGLEIKDVESKLSHASGKRSKLTPFLDKLVIAFEKYCNRKE